MSRQTDELFLYQPNEQQQDAPVLPAEDITRMRERIRLLLDLQKHPGFAMYISGLVLERVGVEVEMDRTDNPTILAKAAGRHYALNMVVGYIPNEIARLEQILNAVDRR